jgi:hypothetical protein
MIVLFAILFGYSLVFAQHSHKGHSVDNQTTKSPEVLPTGLSDEKSMDDHPMDVDNCKEKMKDMKDQHMDMDKCKEKMKDMKDHKMTIDSDKSNDSIIRIGEVDLKVIDNNKDGKVFQDQMDWNVISDEPGNCPKCNMTLKEVTLEKAKENLIKHDFKVKEL